MKQRVIYLKVKLIVYKDTDFTKDEIQGFVQRLNYEINPGVNSNISIEETEIMEHEDYPYP